MKTSITLLMLFICLPVHADVLATTTPGPSFTASSIAGPVPVTPLSDGPHLLDNVIPGGCRDVINGTWMECTGEALYKEYYLSFDAVHATPVGGQGFFSPGVRVYVGQFLLEQVPSIQKLATTDMVLRSVLNYLTVGGFYTRDFGNHLDRAGYYLGLLLKFGG